MTPEDAGKYKTDAEFRAKVDQNVKDGMPEGTDARRLADSLLKQVGETGQPPKVEGLNKIFMDQSTVPNLKKFSRMPRRS